MSLIFLIGMPGAGKSYWARKIAEAWQWQLVDMDGYIERREGMSISTIFEQWGEGVFRRKEREALALICANTAPAIIACGGGAPCYFDNMEYMRGHGRVVYLRSPIPELVQHLKSEMHLRPLLAAHPEPELYLTDLLASRGPVYEQAHHIIDTSNLTPDNYQDTFNKIKQYV